MSGFSNTNYNTTTNSVIKNYQDRVNQCTLFTKFTNQKPTPVTYWNINSEATTMDRGTIQSYDQLSDEDSYRYNQINNFFIYGLGRIEPNIQVEEFGPHSSPIEGEAYIRPNILIPCENDYFTISYLINGDQYILFRVIEVQRDTLDNNANWYRIHYQMDQTLQTTYKQLVENQTVNVYEYVDGMIGTNQAAFLTQDQINSIENLSKLRDQLREFYINLFYKRNIQTFIYPYDMGAMLIYDPYLIEFLIRNKVFLTYDENYLYISQATFRSSTFSIEYNKTLFRSIEERDPELLLNTAWPIQICDPNSLLVDRMEEYLELSVQRQNYNFHEPINFLDMHLFDRIVNNKPYDESDPSFPHYRNIIINFINGKDVDSLTPVQTKSIHNLEYAKNKIFYYEIPLLVHAFNTYISDLMSGNSLDPNDTSKTVKCCNPECFVFGN